MARIFPTPPLAFAPATALTAGAARELDVLQALHQGLPENYDVFCNVEWSAMLQGGQSFGEFDLVVLTPAGHVLIVEVKAGGLDSAGAQLTKTYRGEVKDVGVQMRRMHGALMSRMQQGMLPQVQVQSLLVVPDATVAHAPVAYPPERIVDATRMNELCGIVMRHDAAPRMSTPDRERWRQFLCNRFDVVIDVATQVDQARQASRRLADGLATWVPRISPPQGLYQIEATAGSGKTQLALGLLHEAATRRERALYACFNRPLADHLAQLAPATAEVTTFHQLCRDHAERSGITPDFSDPGTFALLEQRFLDDRTVHWSSSTNPRT